MPEVKDNSVETGPTPKVAPTLPLNQDAPLQDRAIAPSQKDFHKTIGAKLTQFLIYGVLGFGANSGLSVGITYFLMPKEKVKILKNGLAKGMQWIFSGAKDPLRAANRTVEIGIMMFAGTVLTACMAPLVERRDKIAHWINRKLDKDTDVIPDHLKKIPPPRTREELIQQEIDKRVKKRHSSGDLWKARWLGLLVPLAGDFGLSMWNSKRENVKGDTVSPSDWNYEKWSADTKVWEAGGKIYDKMLAKSKRVEGLSNFLKSHGAGTEDMKKNSPESYNMLEAIEKKHNFGHVNEARVMVAEQTRMLTKEVGWTIILAVIIEKLVGFFHDGRVKDETKKAIADITKEGLVPEGYKVVLKEGVKLERIGGAEDKASWVDKTLPAKQPRTEKAETFVKTADARRGSEQPSLV